MTTQMVADSDLPATPGEETTSPALAGFGRRLGARVIDSLVIVYGITLGALALLAMDRDCSILSCRAWSAIFVVVVFLAVAGYEIFPTASLGRTLGKRAVGIEVVRADGDGPPSLGRAALRFLVLFGLILLFPLVLVSFIGALRNPRKQMWHDRAGRTIVVRRVREPQGRRWVRVVRVAVVVLASLGVGGYLVDRALPNELINVSFEAGVKPFEVGENSFGRADHVEGTYRLTAKTANEPFTSLGDFVRTAYAVGIRAEVVEMTERGTLVGVYCLGPAGEGVEGLVGYGFFVEPGGAFVLGRNQDPGGSNEVLKHGTDARFDEVKRVSLKCVRDLNGDVSLTGYVNGLEVVTDRDPNGYGAYTYAGLTVSGKQAGTEVRFTRVWARVPDEEWMP